MASLFSYLPTHTLFVELEQLQEQGARFYQDAQQRFENHAR